MTALLIGFGGLAAVVAGFFGIIAFALVGKSGGVLSMFIALFLGVTANLLIWAGGEGLKPQ